MDTEIRSHRPSSGTTRTTYPGFAVAFASFFKTRSSTVTLDFLTCMVLMAATWVAALLAVVAAAWFAKRANLQASFRATDDDYADDAVTANEGRENRWQP